MSADQNSEESRAPDPKEDQVGSAISDPSQASSQTLHASTAEHAPFVFGAQAALDHEPTVISRRPAAAPAEFYRSLSLVELGKSLEGRQLDHFRLDRMIGGGGMGAVFHGRDLRLDREVAIKVIPESRRDPETLRRFRTEAQSAARLDHPNIARVYDIGEDETWNYIVFEYIEGINLRDLVQTQGPLSIDDAVFFTRQVAEALQHAHQRDVVHRDIKPSNVIITPGGMAKVVDMGLARNTSMDKSTADQTASGVTLGTFDYISPEQARDPRDADVRSDLYSLGCTLFYMLTGKPPFPEGTALQKLLSHGSQPPPDPRLWREDVSDQLHAVLEKLMAKRPADRYQKPLDLINDLLLIAQVEGLQRSRAATTLLITPSVAQRTFLELHLPWMTAAAAVLAIAFWLGSADSLTTPFEIPRPELRLSSGTELKFPTVPVTPIDSRSETKGDGLPSVRKTSAEPIQPTAPLNSSAGGSNTSGIEDLPRPRTDAGIESASGATRSMRAGELGPLSSERLKPPSLPSVVPETIGNLAGDTSVPGLDALNSGFPIAPVPGAGGVSGVLMPPGDFVSPKLPDSASRGQSPGRHGAASDVIFVSSSQPTSIPAGQWADTLSEALLVCASNSQYRTIELLEPMTVSSRLVIPCSGLSIRGSSGKTAELRFSLDPMFGPAEGNSLIQVGEHALLCQDLAITYRHQSLQDPATVFALTPGGRIEMSGCQIAVTSMAGEAQLASFTLQSTAAGRQGADARRSIDGESDESVSSGPTLVRNEPISIQLKECRIRGRQTMVRMTAPCRTEITLQNGFAALDGRILSAVGLESARMPATVRVMLDRSTIVTGQGFAILQAATGADRLPVALNRTAQDCVFWSPALVPHLLVDGLTGSEQLGDSLLLGGKNNAYDQNIESLCQCRNVGGAIEDFDFTDAPGEWYSERFNEYAVRWQNPVPPEIPVEDQSPEDYRLRSGMFLPGYLPATERSGE
ncbi:MAG: protein kinase [Pirellulales bacterium]